VNPRSSQSFVSYSLCSRFEDTKEVIRIHKSKKDRQQNGQKKKGQEEFEDTKAVNRIRKSKKDRQRNGQKKEENNDLQNITYKTKDRQTRTQLKIGGESRCFGRESMCIFFLFYTIHHRYE